jgi:hypothetical protein
MAICFYLFTIIGILRALHGESGDGAIAIAVLWLIASQNER